MADPPAHRTESYVTPRGPLTLHVWAPPEAVEPLQMDEGIGRFPQYRSIIGDAATLARVATYPDGNVTLAVDESRQAIVGYSAWAYPDRHERWGKMVPVLYELGSIEVSRNWRRCGLARAMTAAALANDWFEDKITFLTGYSWHWDLEGAGLNKVKYREMMMALFRPFGFEQYYTNEGNVAMDFSNLFMARIGARVSAADRERFADLLFLTADYADRWKL